MEKIAILLATYNGEEFIREQVQSIFDNTEQDFCIYICDDGSKDKTLEIAGEMAKDHPGQLVLCPNEKNLGVVRNFLCAAKRTQAEYIMFSDQDDVWLPYKLEHTLKALQDLEGAEKKPALVYGDAKVVDGDLKVIHPSFHKQGNLNTSALDLAHLLMENKLIGCTIMFNHALQQHLTDFPDGIKVHDWWMALVACCFGQIGYVNEPLLLYRQHGDNTYGSMSEFQYILRNLNKIGDQKKFIRASYHQAEVFLDTYREDLSPAQIDILDTFAKMPERNWFMRRHLALKYGFMKTGPVRNIGNFLLLL